MVPVRPGLCESCSGLLTGGREAAFLYWANAKMPSLLKKNSIDQLRLYTIKELKPTITN